MFSIVPSGTRWWGKSIMPPGLLAISLLLTACSCATQDPTATQIGRLQQQIRDVNRDESSPEAVSAESITGVGPRRDALAAEADSLARRADHLSDRLAAHQLHDEATNARRRIWRGDYEGAAGDLRQMGGLYGAYSSAPRASDSGADVAGR